MYSKGGRLCTYKTGRKARKTKVITILFPFLVFTADVGKGESFWAAYTILYFSTSTEFFFSFFKFPVTYFPYVYK